MRNNVFSANKDYGTKRPYKLYLYSNLVESLRPNMSESVNNILKAYVSRANSTESKLIVMLDEDIFYKLKRRNPNINEEIRKLLEEEK